MCSAWDNKSASGAIGHQYFPRNLGLPGMGPDKTTAEGEYDMQYAIRQPAHRHVIVDSAVPLGYWRSVGHSHNAFFKEGFLDEVAHAAGKDSVEFRRELLQIIRATWLCWTRRWPRPAARRKAARMAWRCTSRSAASSRRWPRCRSRAREIRVHRVVCAVDCGIVVNPNIIAQQVESAVVFGLSAALGGEITIKDGQRRADQLRRLPGAAHESGAAGRDHDRAERRAARGHGRTGLAAGGAGGGERGVQVDR
jgi:isoquinoline 1-oxidoreductase beta subunit